MKILKYLTLLLICAQLILLIYHRSFLKRADIRPPSSSHLVSVDGHRMSIQVMGDGEQTLVLLSGYGTTSPILDFKPLAEELSRDCRVVIVERFGYGFSDVVAGRNRETATVLADTRAAMKQADMTGSFVLVPHSAASLEAMTWATSYPEEVTAIVGLDMALPASYADTNIHLALFQLGQGGRQLGWSHLLPTHILSAGADLTSTDQKLYRALVAEKALNSNMQTETQMVKSNAQTLTSIFPTQPLLLLTSNGQGTGFSKEKWQSYADDFALGHPNMQVKRLDASHYLHHQNTQTISDEIRAFIN